jgi:predicted NBD/HSP70 family sugar kinase
MTAADQHGPTRSQLIDDRHGGPLVVGVDLGGTRIRAGIAGLDGIVMAHRDTSTSVVGGRDLLAQIAELVDGLCEAIGRDSADVEATCIGGAGVPDAATGQFLLAPNLGELSTFSFIRELSHVLGHAVTLENDVNVAAIGELHEGIGREHDCFAFISVGTGIGMGLIIDRKLVAGVSGGAGEIGFLPFGADPVDPQNHRRGALEEVVAGDAISGRYANATDTGAASARLVFDRAAEGDSAATESLDDEAKWLAHAISAVIAIVDPGPIVLGGGIGSRQELIAPIRRWLSLLGRGTADVRTSELGERAPIVGAVRSAIEALSLPRKGAQA